jgi:hypothetical protein
MTSNSLRRRVRALEDNAPTVIPRLSFEDYLAEKGISYAELRAREPDGRMGYERAELFLDYFCHRCGHSFTDMVVLRDGVPCRKHGPNCPARSEA